MDREQVLITPRSGVTAEEIMEWLGREQWAHSGMVDNAIVNASYEKRVFETQATEEDDVLGRKPKLNVDGFEGIVMTMDWVTTPDGRLVRGYRGNVRILSAKAAAGFEPTGHNTANWLARIEGPMTSVNLMGCQVRQVFEGDLSAWDTREICVVP